MATESSTAEEVIRTVVRANAEKDLATMSQLMAHDEDCINYTIGGRKYVGWSELETDLQEEFETVASLEIPIHELTVWTRGEIESYCNPGLDVPGAGLSKTRR